MTGHNRRPFILNASGLALVCFFNTPISTFAQSQFEVASIKTRQAENMDREGNRREEVDTTPGHLAMRNVSLSSCIRWAYGVQKTQVSGPGWLEMERFDLVGNAAGPASEEQLKLMLRSLLGDRFKLTLHRESRTTSVYILVVGKNGTQMKVSSGDGKSTRKGSGMDATFEKTSMAELAEILSVPVPAPVIDKTELSDRFDFRTNFSGFFVPGATMDDLPAFISRALQDQLGLKLESRKAPLEILVIDHAERVPSEN